MARNRLVYKSQRNAGEIIKNPSKSGQRYFQIGSACPGLRRGPSGMGIGLKAERLRLSSSKRAARPYLGASSL